MRYNRLLTSISLLSSLLVVALGVGVWAATVPQYTILHTDTAIPVDGVIGAEWAKAPAVYMEPDDPVTKEFGQTWQTASFRATWRALWDEQNLYFAAIVEDDQRNIIHTADQIYLNDAVAIFLYDEASGINYKLFVTPLGLDRKGEPLAGWAGMNEPPNRPLAKGKVAGSSSWKDYTIEMAIPWSEISPDFTPKPGDRLRFTVLVMDADDNGAWGQTMWAGHGDTPDSFAELTFVGAAASAAAE